MNSEPMNEQDLYQIERASRHVMAALQGIWHIPDERLARDVDVQIKRLEAAEGRLRSIVKREMKRQGVTQEDIDEASYN